MKELISFKEEILTHLSKHENVFQNYLDYIQGPFKDYQDFLDHFINQLEYLK
jgi:hypothetical protein